MERELNKRLLEWAGFKWKSVTLKQGAFEATFTGWWRGDNFAQTLEFTQSLDAIFKWLVPKLDYYFSFKFWQTLYKDETRRWVCQAYNKGWVADFGKVETYAETPALALCKAIEKLIDAQE